MNEILLREIAERIAREQFLLQWPIYALMLAIALVVGFGAAYIGSYAKKRGENFATKLDFDGLLTQLKMTTSVAEEVKAQVSHADWATRELKTLRRLKLEELLRSIYELQEWQELERDARIFNSKKDPGPSPLPKVELLVGLYLPELRESIYECNQIHREMTIEILQACENVLLALNDSEAQRSARQQFGGKWRALYQKQIVTISAIEKQCRDIMAELIGGPGSSK